MVGNSRPCNQSPPGFARISVEIEDALEKDMYKDDDQEDHPWNDERQLNMKDRTSNKAIRI